MTLDALASVDDVTALLGGTTGVADDTLDAMLASASARFRQEAQEDFAEVETSAVLRFRGGRTTLPGPVIEVASVATVSSDGSKGYELAFSFDGIDGLYVSTDPVVRLISNATAPVMAWVTWTHGYSDVPEDVRWAVAAMVQRAATAPSAGLTGETLGGYAWQGGGYTASGSLSMSKDEREVAHRYRAMAQVVDTA